ncbi:hypothetical protein QQ045_024908 [Rhodiola kirilowii]
MGTASGNHPLTDPILVPCMVQAVIVEAIKAGYRHFDTAFGYRSEEPLGEAIAEALSSGLIGSRQELFITTKLWATAAEPHLVLPAIWTSLDQELEDRVHGPVPYTFPNKTGRRCSFNAAT